MCAIIATLLILWLLGLFAHIGAGLIHILLVIAIVLFIFDLLSRPRSL